MADEEKKPKKETVNVCSPDMDSSREEKDAFIRILDRVIAQNEADIAKTAVAA